MALSIDSNNAIVLNNYSFYLSERNTQLNLALRYIKRAVKLRENTASFEDTYAWILYQLGQYSEALKWIEKALSNGGDKSGVINDHYGDILYQLGKTEEALKQWEKAQNLGLDTQAIQDKIRNKGDLMNKKYFILICLALLLLNACGGLKKIWVGPFSNNQTNLDYGAFIDSMKANRLKYEWINVRAKISSNDPNIPQKNLGLNIRSRKDSIIWLSISAKGISGLRVLMT